MRNDHSIFVAVLVGGSFEDTDDVVAMANDTHYGLAAYVYTNDLSTAMRTGALNSGDDNRVKLGAARSLPVASSSGPR